MPRGSFSHLHECNMGNTQNTNDLGGASSERSGTHTPSWGYSDIEVMYETSQ